MYWQIFIKSGKLNLPEKEERAAFGKRLKRSMDGGIPPENRTPLRLMVVFLHEIFEKDNGKCLKSLNCLMHFLHNQRWMHGLTTIIGRCQVF